MNKQQLIADLQLEPHLEGGYYRRTYSSKDSAPSTTHAPANGAAATAEDQKPADVSTTRLFMSSIYYLLTDDSPIGHFHRNRSDIVHYWHHGSSLTYYLIDPQGQFQTAVLGPDIAAGEQFQLLVPGGFWKATRLTRGEYGLLSEAVCPGFDYADMELARAAALATEFPELWRQHQTLFTELCQA